MKRSAVFLTLSVIVAAGCATATVKHSTVRFVNESEAVRLQPVVTILASPTKSDDELRLRLTRKVHAPLYEVDVTEEQARTLDVRRIFVVAFTSLTGGGVSVSTTDGKTIIRGRPRKVKDVEVIEEPWPSASATIDIEGVTRSQLASDGDGRAAMKIGPILKALNRRPTGALKLTVSASNGVETDTKVIEVAADALAAWFGN